MNVLQSLKISYLLIESKADLQPYFDRLVECCQSMLKKTGEHGQTCETLIKQVMSFVGSELCYLLIGLNGDNKMVGFLFALLIPDSKPWIEVQALWTEPGIATEVKQEVFDLLKQWAISLNANKILASITRSPDLFYEFFYAPLGFTKVGYILEVKL